MSTQKALYLLEAKGQFAVREKNIPEPGTDEVLVEIHAAALNPVDWKIQTNDIIVKEYPAILGLDAAGIVKKVGNGVTNVDAGDKVYVNSETRHHEVLTTSQGLPGLLRRTSRRISAVRRCSR